jgi:hypothetical protein
MWLLWCFSSCRKISLKGRAGPEGVDFVELRRARGFETRSFGTLGVCHADLLFRRIELFYLYSVYSVRSIEKGNDLIRH